MKIFLLLNFRFWLVTIFFVATLGGCTAKEAILVGGTAAVYGPFAAGGALVGGTIAGVGLMLGGSATEERISAEDPHKWQTIYGLKGLDPKSSGDWIVKEYKARKNTENERDMLYLSLEYRVKNNAPYPDAKTPLITVGEIRDKLKDYDGVLRITGKKPRKYTFKDYIQETSNPLAQN